MVDFTKMRIDKLIGPKGAAQKHPQLLPLLGDISGGKLPTGKEKIDSSKCSGELPVRSIYRRVMACAVDKALLKCADKTGLRSPAEMGIYYDVENKCKVATNRFVLVVIPDATLDGKPRIAGGEAYSGDLPKPEDFPNYRGVIPDRVGQDIKDLDLVELLAKARGAARASAFCKSREVLVVVKNVEFEAYDAKLMELALVALISTGTRRVDLELSNPLLIIRDTNTPDKLAGVRPMDKKGLDPFIFTHLTPYSFE